MPNNEVLTDEIEPQRVKKRRIGSTDVFTIPAVLKQTAKSVREALKNADSLWEVNAERTPEGNIIISFKEVKE